MKKVSAATARGGRTTTMKACFQQFLTACVFAVTLAVLVPSFSWNSNNNALLVANAKEIQATKDWTLLGENDTIDAGMHVRMDLTTGEKWVKLPDDENDENEKAASVGMTGESSSSSSSASSSSGVAVVPETTSTVDNEQPKAAAAEDEGPDYDYEMMHRTLSQLPPDEQERMGGLPKLPEAADSGTAATTSITAKEREMFQARMKEIWLRRQEELRQVQEEHVVDLPRILKFRIQAIREYLDNPLTVLEQMELEESSDDSSSKEDGGHPDESDEEDDDNVTMIPATNLVALLQDLEFHLNDLDMTRDFYTLGGWPLLASLVSKNVHYISNSTTVNNDLVSSTTDNSTSTTTTTTSAISIGDKVLVIRAQAAWALGTAVKNIGEFRSWVLEPIAALIVEDATDTTMTASTTTTTPLNLVVQGFLEASSSNSDAASNEDSSSTLKYQQQLAQKTMYALGSFLRGNPQAQVAFSTMSTVTDNDDKKTTNLAQLLGQKVSQWVKEAAATTSSTATKAHTMKMTTRLLSLADDVVNDVQLHAEDGSRRALTTAEQDAKVIDAFSSSDWCLAAHQAATASSSLLSPSLQEAALRVVATIGPHCSSSYNSKHVVDLAMLMKRTHDTAGDDDDKERLQLVEKALAAIGTTPKVAATKK